MQPKNEKKKQKKKKTTKKKNRLTSRYVAGSPPHLYVYTWRVDNTTGSFH